MCEEASWLFSQFDLSSAKKIELAERDSPHGLILQVHLNIQLKSKKVALGIGHVGLWNNAMIYLSEHQTIFPIPNSQSNLY